MTLRLPAPSKYGARRVELDGYTFDSAMEARRYGELQLLARAGAIMALEVHPRYDLVVNGLQVGVYTADFRYRTAEGEDVVEDVKGVRTRDYVLRKRLVAALYGVQVREVQA